MHVGLNLVYLVPGETGGTEVVARELIPALVTARPDVRFTCFVNREAAAASGGPWKELTGTVTVPVRASRRSEWVRGEQQLLPRLVVREGVDVLHSLANTGPAWGRFARIVTVHDLIHRFYPDAHGGLKARGMALLVPLAATLSGSWDSTAARSTSYRLASAPPDAVRLRPRPRCGSATGSATGPSCSASQPNALTRISRVCCRRSR